jgi:RNA polymerase sigma-70 factor (ECF subfamily)
MQQRIVRAKKKISQARIPFRVLDPHELPERLPGVLQAVYSIFTEGYAAQRTDLADEAIRLARILRSLMPGEREVTGLLALMLLVHARRDARAELLEDQDRTLWDQDMIAEGSALTELALTGGHGPYGVQAAINALHDQAEDFTSTDWPQIVALYDVLDGLAPSPVVALNRAAAVAMRDGPVAGLALLDELAGEPRLRDYHPFRAARADLLHRLGRCEEAAQAYREAIALAGTESEQDFLRRRLSVVEGRS